MQRWLVWFARIPAFFVVALTGCGGAQAGSKPTSSATVFPDASAIAGAPTPAHEQAPTDTGANDNDAEIVAAAKAALDCPWDDGFRLNCKAFEAWSFPSFDLAKDGGRTLVNMLEAPDEKTHWLAAKGLEHSRVVRKMDKPMASRIVALAEKEKGPLLGYELGWMLAELDYDKTGTWERVVAIVHGHPLTNLRRAVVSHMVSVHPDEDAVVRLAMDMVTDADETMRIAAIEAFTDYAGSKGDVCPFLRKNADLNSIVGTFAARILARNAKCSDELDALLTSVATHVESGAPQNSDEDAVVLGDLCGNPKATDAEKTKAAGIAKTLASPIRGWRSFAALPSCRSFNATPRAGRTKSRSTERTRTKTFAVTPRTSRAHRDRRVRGLRRCPATSEVPSALLVRWRFRRAESQQRPGAGHVPCLWVFRLEHEHVP